MINWAKMRSEISFIGHRRKSWLEKLTLIAVMPMLFSTLGWSQETSAALATSGPATTETYVTAPRKYMLGDWDGARTRLEDKGVTFDLHYVVDALSNVSGGREQANTAWGRIRASTDIDFGKLAGWNGTSFHATGLYQYGANLGAQYIGAIANPSSLVSAHALRLDSWWLQQSLVDGKLVFRAGQFAGQDFYGVREYGASFLSESMGYALGNLFTVYESFDPAGTPAAEVRVIPTPNYYFKTAVLSGNRNPYQQDDNGLHFTIKDPPVFASEVGYLVNPPSGSTSTKTLGPQPPAAHGVLTGSYKLGAAYNDGKFTDPANGVTSKGNYLIYAEASQAVYRRGTVGMDAKRGLDLTFGFDWSPSDVNRVNSQFTAGARYIGLIPRRNLDELSLGLVQSHVSDHFNTAATPLAPAQTYGSEQTIELTYRALITPWLVFQPDFQYYVKPGGLDNASYGNAVVLGFRTKITF